MRDIVVTVNGRLGSDPKSDTVNTKNGVQTVARISIAGTNSYDKPIWFSITLWGKTAEYFLQYAKKGDGVFVVGELTGDDNGKPRMWTDKEGATRAQWGLDNLKTCQLIQKGAKEDRQARDVTGGGQQYQEPPWPGQESQSSAGFNFAG